MNAPSWLLVLALSSLSFLVAARLLTAIVRLSAAWIHAIWLLALVVPALSLFIAFGEWEVRLPVLSAEPHVGLLVPQGPVFEAFAPIEQMPPAGVGVAGYSESEMRVSVGTIWGAVWGLGCAIVLVLLATSHFRISLDLRRAKVLEVPERLRSAFDAMRRESGVRAEVLVCDFSAVPFCYGFFRPLVVFPKGVVEWSDEMIRACLAHELAHLSRGDLVSLGLAQCCCGLAWFNPFAWFGLGRLRAAAECAADDIANAQPEISKDYASQLIAVAALVRRGRFDAVTFPMARPGQLWQRIDALMNESRHRKAPGFWSFLLLAGILTLLFTASLTVKLVAAEPKLDALRAGIGNSQVPPIEVANDGDFHTENGLVIATDGVRLSWQGFTAQGDRLEYDTRSGALILSAKADSFDRWKTVFRLRLRDGEGNSPVVPLVERRTDLPRPNSAKALADPKFGFPVEIVADGRTAMEDGAAVATENAMLSKGDVAMRSDRLEYRQDTRSMRFFGKGSGDAYALIVTGEMLNVNQAVYDLAKRYLTAVKDGDEPALRKLIGVDLLSNLSAARRGEIEADWIREALSSRAALSKPLDDYTISATTWSGAGIDVAAPLYWPVSPSYHVRILGASTSIDLAVCEPSEGRFAIILPLSSDRDPGGALGFANVPKGFADPRLSSPPILAATAPAPGEIAAMVNDVPITKVQVDAWANSRPQPKMEQEGAGSDELKKQYLNDLIDKLLVLKEWDRMRGEGATIPQAVIDDRVNTIIRGEFQGDRARFLKAITMRGYTLESFRENEAVTFIVQAVTQSQLDKMFPIPSATSEEAKRRQRQWLDSLRAKAGIQYF